MKKVLPRLHIRVFPTRFRPSWLLSCPLLRYCILSNVLKLPIVAEPGNFTRLLLFYFYRVVDSFRINIRRTSRLFHMRSIIETVEAAVVSGRIQWAQRRKTRVPYFLQPWPILIYGSEFNFGRCPNNMGAYGRRIPNRPELDDPIRRDNVRCSWS